MRQELSLHYLIPVAWWYHLVILASWFSRKASQYHKVSKKPREYKQEPLSLVTWIITYCAVTKYLTGSYSREEGFSLAHSSRWRRCGRPMKQLDPLHLPWGSRKKQNCGQSIKLQDWSPVNHLHQTPSHNCGTIFSNSSKSCMLGFQTQEPGQGTSHSNCNTVMYI